MKEGPGEDPFADNSDDDDETSVSSTDTDSESVLDPTTERDTEPTDTMRTDQIPYVVRRQTVKEDRDNEHVAFLRDEYAQLEDEIRSDVADELDMRPKDVSVTDLREAFVELAAENPEAVAAILNAWGYEHLK